MDPECGALQRVARTETEIAAAFGAPTEVETLTRRARQAQDPKVALRAARTLRERVAELELLQVSMALEAGLSWTRIACALGISRQAAHKRYSRRVRCSADGTSRPGRMLVTTEARHAVHLARREARALGAGLVGTEHLLLGILGCERSHATWALHAMGARHENLRDAVDSADWRLGEAESDGRRRPAWRGLTSDARRALARSLEEALDRDEGYIGVEHLVLAVLRDSRGGAARALRRIDVDPREVVSRLSEL